MPRRDDSIASTSAVLVWQGWRMRIPSRWNPIRIEGDRDAGYVLLADMHRHRLGVRWKKAGGRRFDAQEWSTKAMRAEVGQLATEEAKPITMPTGQWAASLLYHDGKPPGRDVWAGYSVASSRGIELIYHNQRGERALQDRVLPTLADEAPEKPMPWSIFGLSCIIPPGMTLVGQQFNAGDLSMTFQKGKITLTVRQLSLASQALSVVPLSKWLARQEWQQHKNYRPSGEPQEIDVELDTGTLRGLQRTLNRRMRFFWKFAIPAQLHTCVLHDAPRDRLILVQSSQEELAEAVIPTIGWATSRT